ncbi:hypothetical protein BO71DRAFT_169128 [Aspergillus ellipticus CBS 707.79]|uniref:Uncharacterized protein n=1 Tax=Aspergillus ellipticus CBS 707.79 TaxID=1448320 RepID=A0A319CTH9_9EURO|nr:hypothetical protein BO71DRAFT_169128 [Aspergillus ellipticus CBS 707.79]
MPYSAQHDQSFEFQNTKRAPSIPPRGEKGTRSFGQRMKTRESNLRILLPLRASYPCLPLPMSVARRMPPCNQ